MLDVFRLVHGEIVHDGWVKPIKRKAFQNAERFAQLVFDPNTLPGRELIEGTNSFDDHAKFFNLIYNQHLRECKYIPPLERIFLEIVLLHKLQIAHPITHKTFQEDLPHIVLGAMSQRKLTNLLMQLEANCRFDVFHFGRVDGIDREIWETAFMGAASCVRVMRAAMSIPGTHILSSTLTEDINYGIDLYLTTDQGMRFCVSVKSGNKDASMSGERVETYPATEHPTFNTDAQFKIFNGVTRMNELHIKNEPFIACLVRVGKQPGRLFDLELYPDDKKCIHSLLEPASESLAEKTIA